MGLDLRVATQPPQVVRALGVPGSVSTTAGAERPAIHPADAADGGDDQEGEVR